MHGLLPLVLPSFLALAPLPPAAGEEPKLIATDPGLHDHFGRSLSLAGDTFVTGSRFDEHSGVALAGSAYVFERAGGDWTQAAKLIASDFEFQDLFGHAVATDGQTVLVSARNDDHGGAVDAGSVYVFVRSGSSWIEEAKLTADDAASGDNFGISVAIDGDRALIGALYGGDEAASNAGAAYVFERGGAGWTQTGKLIASDPGVLDGFGWSVALDGDSALLGARFDNVAGGADAGSAYVFAQSGGDWVEAAKLTATGPQAGDQFGSFVALRGDRAVVGNPLRDTPGGINAGTAVVFEHSGGLWSEVAVLAASDAGAGDEFGHTVALDGDVVVVGASQADTAAGVDTGAAYVFARTEAGWLEHAALTAYDAAPAENYGSIVAVSGDTALVGAPHDNYDGIVHPGSVYPYPLGDDCNGNGVGDFLDVSFGSSLDLDAEGTPDECQALAADAASVSLAAGGAVQFTLDGGAPAAGAIYVLLGSFAGVDPGLAVDGALLPLNLDGYLLTLLAGGGPIANNVGLLDPVGAGAATFALPPIAEPGGLTGATVHHAFAVFDPSVGQVTATSNAIPTVLLP